MALLMNHRDKNSIEGKIGRNLTSLRVAKGESASGLAAASGVAEERIRWAEDGLLRLSPEELLAICDVLDVTPSQLIDEEE